MSATLCSARERSLSGPKEEAAFHLLPETQAMGDRLTMILTEHHVPFETRARAAAPLIVIVGPQKHSRIAALLRHILAEGERRAVSVFSGDGSEFPAVRLLDEWWRVHETAWFAKALSENRFVTWFQPVVDTAQQRVIGHECLIRLPHGRCYSGAEILDAAWVRDEIHVFDAYARDLAIRSAAQLSVPQQSAHGIYFVNFMPSSMLNPELCLKTTQQTLRDCGLQPRNIVFEVVESELVDDRALLHRICDLYRSHGFGLALDDVGTGAGSLRMVQDLQPNYVKLATSLVQNVEQPLYAATIRKQVEFADRLGVTLVAKGVERPEVMENLWLLGVQTMQGYLFGSPAPQLYCHQNDLSNLAAATGTTGTTGTRNSGQMTRAERGATPALAIN